MKRSILIAAIAVVVLGVIGAGAYVLFFSSAKVAVAPPGSVSLPAAGPRTNDIGTSTASSLPATQPTKVSARLVKISGGPVVPALVALDVAAPDASSSPSVRVKFIERQSGNVFSYDSAVGVLTRTSNRTVPGIERAYWLPSGLTAFVQYLSGDAFSTVNTYALPAESDPSASSSAGFFLPQNLAGLAVSSTSALALAAASNGASASLYKTKDGTYLAKSFTTPLSALAVSFAGKNSYFAYTKPSAALSGSAYLIDRSGNFARVAGPLNGLVALVSHSGKRVLASYVNGSGLHMELVDVAGGSVLPLPIATIADKCAWSADDSAIYCGVPQSPSVDVRYPDDWYQGAVHFSDRIWKIDVAGRFVQFVLDISKESGGAFDAEALALDPSASILVMVNKSDGSLWSYSL